MQSIIPESSAKKIESTESNLTQRHCMLPRVHHSSLRASRKESTVNVGFPLPEHVQPTRQHAYYDPLAPAHTHPQRPGHDVILQPSRCNISVR